MAHYKWFKRYNLQQRVFLVPLCFIDSWMIADELIQCNRNTHHQVVIELAKGPLNATITNKIKIFVILNIFAEFTE